MAIAGLLWNIEYFFFATFMSYYTRLSTWKTAHPELPFWLFFVFADATDYDLGFSKDPWVVLKVIVALLSIALSAGGIVLGFLYRGVANNGYFYFLAGIFVFYYFVNVLSTCKPYAIKALWMDDIPIASNAFLAEQKRITKALAAWEQTKYGVYGDDEDDESDGNEMDENTVKNAQNSTKSKLSKSKVWSPTSSSNMKLENVTSTSLSTSVQMSDIGTIDEKTNDDSKKPKEAKGYRSRPETTPEPREEEDNSKGKKKGGNTKDNTKTKKQNSNTNVKNKSKKSSSTTDTTKAKSNKKKASGNKTKKTGKSGGKNGKTGKKKPNAAKTAARKRRQKMNNLQQFWEQGAGASGSGKSEKRKRERRAHEAPSYKRRGKGSDTLNTIKNENGKGGSKHVTRNSSKYSSREESFFNNVLKDVMGDEFAMDSSDEDDELQWRKHRKKQAMKRKSLLRQRTTAKQGKGKGKGKNNKSGKSGKVNSKNQGSKSTNQNSKNSKQAKGTNKTNNKNKGKGKDKNVKNSDNETDDDDQNNNELAQAQQLTVKDTSGPGPTSQEKLQTVAKAMLVANDSVNAYGNDANDNNNIDSKSNELEDGLMLEIGNAANAVAENAELYYAFVDDYGIKNVDEETGRVYSEFGRYTYRLVEGFTYKENLSKKDDKYEYYFWVKGSSKRRCCCYQCCGMYCLYKDHCTNMFSNYKSFWLDVYRPYDEYELDRNITDSGFMRGFQCFKTCLRLRPSMTRKKAIRDDKQSTIKKCRRMSGKCCTRTLAWLLDNSCNVLMTVLGLSVFFALYYVSTEIDSLQSTKSFEGTSTSNTSCMYTLSVLVCFVCCVVNCEFICNYIQHINYTYSTTLWVM